MIVIKEEHERARKRITQRFVLDCPAAIRPKGKSDSVGRFAWSGQKATRKGYAKQEKKKCVVKRRQERGLVARKMALT